MERSDGADDSSDAVSRERDDRLGLLGRRELLLTGIGGALVALGVHDRRAQASAWGHPTAAQTAARLESLERRFAARVGVWARDTGS